MQYEIYNFADLTGNTHKELGAEEAIEDALKRGLEAICVISSGNYIEALRDAAKPHNLSVYNLVGSKPRSEYEIAIPQGEILITNEKRVALVKEAGFQGRIDDYTDFIPSNYAVAAEEILANNPDYVVCPIGSGKLWWSLVQKSKNLGLATKVIGITPKGKNAFYYDSNIRNLDSIADKLTAPYTKLKEEVIAEAPKHIVVEVSERELRKAYRKAKKQGVDCEPSGAAAFVSLEGYFQKQFGLENEKVVVVSTGIGISAMVKNVKLTEKKRRHRFAISAIAASLIMSLSYGFLNNEVERYETLQASIEFSLKNPRLSEKMQFIAGRNKLDSVFKLSEEELDEARILDGMSYDTIDRLVYGEEMADLWHAWELRNYCYEDLDFRIRGHKVCD